MSNEELVAARALADVCRYHADGFYVKLAAAGTAIERLCDEVERLQRELEQCRPIVFDLGY